MSGGRAGRRAGEAAGAGIREAAGEAAQAEGARGGVRRPAAPGRSRWGSCRGHGWGRPQGREDRRLCHSVPWSLPLADRVRPPQGQAQTGPLKLSGRADAPPPGSDKGSRSGQRGLLSPGGRKDTLSDAGEAGADLMEAPRGPDHPGSFRGPSTAGRAWPPAPPVPGSPSPSTPAPRGGGRSQARDVL